MSTTFTESFSIVTPLAQIEFSDEIDMTNVCSTVADGYSRRESERNAVRFGHSRRDEGRVGAVVVDEQPT